MFLMRLLKIHFFGIISSFYDKFYQIKIFKKITNCPFKKRFTEKGARGVGILDGQRGKGLS